MYKDSYFYRARLFPALLTSIPLLIFANKVIAIKYAGAFKNVIDILPLLTHFGFSAAIIFLLVQVNRLVAKEIFQRWFFKEDLYMPTTNNLLWSSSHFSPHIKDKIHSKVNSKFQIILASRTEEQQDELNARKLIVAAVSQIKNLLRGNEMLFRHNIEYGFWRNLVGGSLIAVVFSVIILANGYFGELGDQTTLGIIGLTVYLIPVVFSKLIVRSYGEYYAKVLYDQFLSI